MPPIMCNSYELLGDWKPANRGFTAKAKKGGKIFFLKKYNNYILPNEDKKTKRPTLYKKMKEDFDTFKDYRIKINKKLAEIAGPGGNIIYPTDWFIFENCFVEATEFVPNLIEDEDLLKLPKDAINGIMLTATAAIDGFHRQKIVHSDLKLGNIVAAKNPKEGTPLPALAKILDFDMSYFEDNIANPGDLGGSQQYLSPELTNCMIRDFDDSSLTKLSTKSDIFSLGIIFYNYLAHGNYPSYENLPDYLKKKTVVYAGEAICGGAKIVIDKEDVGEDYLASLIANMLNPDPTKRPTANEVLMTLRMKSVMAPPDSSQIVLKGVKEPDPEGFCDPWPEHDVVFDTEAMVAAGYKAMKRYDPGKQYMIYSEGGKPRKISIDNIKMMHWVVGEKKEKTPSFKKSEDLEVLPGLWEEDAGYEVNEALFKANALTFEGHANKGGKHIYILKDSAGNKKQMNAQNLIILGFLKKK